MSIHTPGEEQADYVVCPCIVILTLFDVQYNYVVDLTVRRGSDVSQDVMIQDEGPEVFCVRVCVGVCVYVCVCVRECVREGYINTHTYMTSRANSQQYLEAYYSHTYT